jgi:hypothetical protein
MVKNTATRMLCKFNMTRSEFQKFISGLTGPQVQALACQHGMKAWKTTSAHQTRTKLVKTPSVIKRFTGATS